MNAEELLADNALVWLPRPMLWLLLIFFGVKIVADLLSAVNDWLRLRYELRMEAMRAEAYKQYLRGESDILPEEHS